MEPVLYEQTIDRLARAKCLDDRIPSDQCKFFVSHAFIYLLYSYPCPLPKTGALRKLLLRSDAMFMSVKYRFPTDLLFLGLDSPSRRFMPDLAVAVLQLLQVGDASRLQIDHALVLFGQI